MSEHTANDKVKRKRGRPKGGQEVVSTQAEAYGISVPILTDNGERFLSPNDIGKILNVTGEAVKQWVYRRKLPAVKLANGFWKIKVSDFEAFLQARTEVGRRHILITDGGNAGTTEIVQAVDALTHHAVVAHNYPDALLKALDHAPALFVICVAPNDKQCWKFAERVRNTKQLRSFPILFIASGNTSDDEAENAIKYDAQGILFRPLNADVLKKEIGRILSRAI